jgi:hypothetical protein
MKLTQGYQVLVTVSNQKMIDALQYLAHDLEQSELNISAWITLINSLDDFKHLMQRATPDWHFETRAQFADKYEDEVQIWDPSIH